MITKKTAQLILIILVLVAIGIGGYSYYSMNKLQPVDIGDAIKDSNATTTSELDRQANIYKQLTNSAISGTTRSILDLLSSTSTKIREQIVSRPPFVKMEGLLTDAKLKSKFIVLNGQEIPSVGAQIYIAFLNEPDSIFRVAYQTTRSTTTPFILTSFEKTEDKAIDILKVLTSLKPYMNDPKMAQ